MTEWRRWRLKYLVQINARALQEDTSPDFDFRYIDISSVGRGILVSEPTALTFGAAPSRARRLVSPGDTIISTVRTYLRAVWPVAGRTDDVVVSTGFAVLSPGPLLRPSFLGWWAQSDVCIEEIVARSVGVSYPAINASDIGDLEIRIPSLAVQDELLNFLETKVEEIDRTVELLGGSALSSRTSLSGLLLEKRQALITAAVTGQLDLTKAGA
jgi:type I restriction enzyme, S subunit